MSTITVNDLKNQPPKQWFKSAQHDDVVVTSEGQPVAVMLPVDATNLEPTLSALRSLRALQAQTALQQAAENNRTSDLTAADIDSEIASARRARSGK